jgi:adenylosuccinate lyase
VLAGRTHGQPGSPTTFGLKVASWADELRRHVDRLREGRRRWAVGQLAGAVGTLAFFGPAGPDLRAAFCAELGLADPGVSWLTARDRIAEFAQLLAMITATLARLGGEIYELQRPELGELREPAAPGGVGSITMPHKRNPETAEQLGTLALLARSSAGVLLETMVQQHERDGRAWKAEWIALPEVCQLTGAALAMARTVTAGLEVDAAAMAANLHAHGGVPGAEQVLAHLSARMGKHSAQRLLHELLRGDSADLADSLAARGVATVDEVRAWLADPAVAVAGVMVDEVVARARRARAAEEARSW